MTPKKIITCRGIGEPLLLGNMLDGLVRSLPGYQRVEIPYPAQYGPVPQILGKSFDGSLRQGIAMVMAELDKGPALLAGYSAGAAVAGHVANIGHKNLIKVGLVADPFQPKGESHNNLWGVAGSRPITGTPAYWVYNPNDMICQSWQNSPIRTIADQSKNLSLATPGAWAMSLLDDWRKGKFQPVEMEWLDLWRYYGRAGHDLTGYLATGQHTNYGRWKDLAGRTRLDYLADWMRK